MNPVHELATVRDWIRYAVSRFGAAGLAFGHGSDNAYDEACYLVLHALNLPAGRLEAFLDARLLPDERTALAQILARRVDERIPAAYLTHEAWLGDFRFYVDARVIVPRSFIAELIPGSLHPFVGDPDRVAAALDLCTGSGCLAILLAHAYPNAEVDAADISADALAVAQRNVRDYGLDGRINLVRSDLFGNLPEKRYDLIVCNPPYVTTAAMEGLPPEYRHEPPLALAGGDDGMDAVRAILAAAPRYLAPKGVIVVEVGHNRAAAEAAFPRLPFVWLSTRGADDGVFLLTRDDLAGSPSGAGSRGVA
jgi:ribosomal protein L3 glutamine methyltransferase